VSKEKNKSNDCRINEPWKLAVVKERGYCNYQGNSEQNQPKSSEDIIVQGKLYKSILGKCGYTSLELTGQKGGSLAVLVTNFRASNPERVGISENKKKQRHDRGSSKL